jgi:palmitoyltransferase
MSEKSKDKRLLGQLFPFVILAYAGVIYYGTIVRLYIMKEMHWYDILIVAVFHVLLLLIVWAYFSAMFVDPGRPPNFWGFYLENPDERRRKYCLICHTFKPERCHHCSTCGKCVLNMDHHCPWLSNCVGFFNRKYFFQLICYTWITLLLALIVTIYPLVRMIIMLSSGGLRSPFDLADFVFCCISFVFTCVLFVTLTNFIAFHWNLIERNSTTLENLEEMRSGHSVGNMYDQGSEFNWAQVMGKNKVLWFIPYIGKSGYPNGDGVVFPSRGSDRDSSIMDFDRNKDNLSDADRQNPLEKYIDKQGVGGGNPTDNFTPYQQKNGYGGTSNPLMNTGNYGFENQAKANPAFENSRSNGAAPYSGQNGLGGYSGGFNTGYGAPAPQNGAPAYNTLSPFQVSRPQPNVQAHTPNKTSPLLYNFS